MSIANRILIENTEEDGDRTSINELVAFLAGESHDALIDIQSKVSLPVELLEPSLMMGKPKRGGDQGRVHGIRSDSASQMLSEKAKLAVDILPLVSIKCTAGAARLRARRRKALVLAFYSDIISTFGGSAVVAILIKGAAASWAILPATISCLGSLFSVFSRYPMLDKHGGARADTEKVLRRLDEVAFDAASTAKELALHMQLDANASALAKLVARANSLARDANVELADYVA